MQVAFYKGRKRLFNRLVSWWLRGPYSHCELVVRIDGAGQASCLSSSFVDGGVRLKCMWLNPEHWDVVPLPGYVSPSVAYQWAYDHAGAGYDVLGLIGFVWRPQRGAPRRWFCSEAVAAVLGYPEPWRFDPMTLWAALAGRTQQHNNITEGVHA
ncbi:hypothetical protein [Acidovorax lacteus]|uniref:Enoyl-CoA hydratase n=1 Tax=Acidovorax lacteus TaxID=1924988 RepID=A0ABP8LC65_9BURK